MTDGNSNDTSHKFTPCQAGTKHAAFTTRYKYGIERSITDSVNFHRKYGNSNNETFDLFIY